ncbi:MAG: hypothetical protein QOG60_460 [Frankiaceae bacterium]|nr:hypothetical protein [Frankiaceae bacterium]
MPLVAAAVCPHPPLLVPSVGRGIDVPARSVACAAVDRLVADNPDVVVLVGADVAVTYYDDSAVGSLAPFGVRECIGLAGADSDGHSDPDSDAAADPPTLPPALTVGAWLLQQTGWTGRRTALGVPETLTSAEASQLGHDLAATEDRVAVLCLGDASARRSEKAPGWLDDRAAGFDSQVAAALADADLEALAGLDAGLARELLAAGRASWQVLAGAAAGTSWDASLLYDAAPFGVGYLVAEWTRAEPG